MPTNVHPCALFFRLAGIAGIVFVLSGMPAEAQRARGGDAQRRGGPGTGNPDEHLVPWRFAEKGAPLATAPTIALYWLPASSDEMQKSALLTSRALLEAELRCVSLLVVLPDDASTIEKLGAAGKLPTAVLMNSEGVVIRRAESVRGVLRPAAVEQIVSDELGARDETMYHDMAEARKRVGTGDSDGAIRLYKKIWDDRCLFPLAGIEAQRALKLLGVTVVEVPKPLAADPGLHLPPPTTTTAPSVPARRRPADKRPDGPG
jgi:hypothetical protein